MNWWNNAEYNAKRTGYATWEGIKTVINSYNPMNMSSNEAARSVALRRGENYSHMANDLVKAGAKVGPGIKLLAKAGIITTAVSLGLDAYTFKTGFSRGWQTYGINYKR